MKANRGLSIFILCIFLATGCAFIRAGEPVRYRNYALNVEEQAMRGEALIMSRTARKAKGARGYGLTEEFGRWEQFEYAEKDSITEEILYDGREGSLALLTYKKSRNGKPVYSESLSFDTGKSDIIKIQHYRLKILRATPEYIRFIVLSDR